MQNINTTNITKNIGATQTNPSAAFFNNYFEPTFAISPGINDSIVSYFQLQTGDQSSAQLLAQAVVDTANAQKEDPLAVLDQFKALPIGQLDAFLALYLNTSRVTTSLLGIQNTTRPNPLVSRLVVT